jgi:hypothetical protein
VAGKRIRTDETPPQAGFRISGDRGLRWRTRICAAQCMAEQGLEGDATTTGTCLSWSDNVRGLHHQVHGIFPHLFESAQVEEHRVAGADDCFYRYVVQGPAKLRANSQRLRSSVRTMCGRSSDRACRSGQKVLTSRLSRYNCSSLSRSSIARVNVCRPNETCSCTSRAGCFDRLLRARCPVTSHRDRFA